MANPEFIDARLYPDFVEAVVGSQRRVVTYEDFTSLLNSFVTSGTNEETSFSLPSSCIYLNKTGSELKAMMYYPEQRHDVKLVNQEFKSVVFPNVLVTCYFRKEGGPLYVISQVRYFATNRSEGQVPKEFLSNPDPERGFIALPMPNMYSGGNMCFGRNSQIPPVDGFNLRGMDWYYQLLYRSPFNNDLSIPGVGRQCSSWLRTLSEAPSFPYSKFHFGDSP